MNMRLCITVAAGCLLASTHVSATPLLSIHPVTTNVTAGDTFSLNVNISGALDLYAFQFDLGFNSAFVEAQGLAEGAFLETGGDTFFVPGTIDNAGGSIVFTANTLLTAISGVDGAGTLATIMFEALAAGTSPISLFNVVLLDSSLSGIGFISQGSSVVVAGTDPTPIPEPSSILLLATGAVAARWHLVGRETGIRTQRR